VITAERRFLLSIQYLLDLAIVAAAWLIAYPLRFSWGLLPLRIQHVPSFSTFAIMGVLVLVVWAAHLRLSRSAAETTVPSFLREMAAVLRAHMLAFVTFVVIVFFVGSYRPSRILFGLFFALSTVGIVFSHYAFRRVLIARRRRGIGLRRVLIVGAGDLAQELVARIKRHPELGLTLVGFLSDDRADIGTELDELTVLGATDDVAEMIEKNKVDQVFVALPLSASSRLERVVNDVSDEMVDVKVVPDLIQYVTLRAGVEEFEGLPLISLKDTPIAGWSAVAKRIFDIVFTLAIFPLILPVMALLTILVKVTSPGPVFYRQERMGLDGKTFDILKFRSMRSDAEVKTGAVWAVEGDSRRTGLGTFMRKTSLDELPQFFNVLAGQMSVVGPRPERPVFIEDFRKKIPKYMLRHKVKAGITGWAQVNGWRGNTDLTKRIECDLYYIQNWSLSLDLRIIWLTVIRGFTGKNAY
jgi:Undecaprenyl-phosphate glucose phosphotransferase